MMPMTILVRETNKAYGKQSILRDESTQEHYRVTSITDALVDKTFVVPCRENGSVKNWNEVYTLTPANHKKVIQDLESGALTTDDFQFKLKF